MQKLKYRAREEQGRTRHCKQVELGLEPACHAGVSQGMARLDSFAAVAAHEQQLAHHQPSQRRP